MTLEDNLHQSRQNEFCPLQGVGCTNLLIECAFDLINRQEAEIERLQTEADRYKRYYFNHEYDKLIAEAKSEAIKEYEKKLLSVFPEGQFCTTFAKSTITLIGKEMVGESKCTQEEK